MNSQHVKISQKPHQRGLLSPVTCPHGLTGLGPGFGSGFGFGAGFCALSPASRLSAMSASPAHAKLDSKAKRTTDTGHHKQTSRKPTTPAASADVTNTGNNAIFNLADHVFLGRPFPAAGVQSGKFGIRPVKELVVGTATTQIVKAKDKGEQGKQQTCAVDDGGLGNKVGDDCPQWGLFYIQGPEKKAGPNCKNDSGHPEKIADKRILQTFVVNRDLPELVFGKRQELVKEAEICLVLFGASHECFSAGDGSSHFCRPHAGRLNMRDNSNV